MNILILNPLNPFRDSLEARLLTHKNIDQVICVEEEDQLFDALESGYFHCLLANTSAFHSDIRTVLTTLKDAYPRTYLLFLAEQKHLLQSQHVYSVTPLDAQEVCNWLQAHVKNKEIPEQQSAVPLSALKHLQGQVPRIFNREDNLTETVPVIPEPLTLHDFILSLERDNEILQAFDLTDTLTGLGSRRLLVARAEDVLQHCKASNDTMALLYIELEDLPVLSRLRGRDTADQLVIEVANRLHSSVREIDTVARLANREFCVVCQHVDPDSGIDQLVQRVFFTLSEKVILSSDTVWQPRINVGAVLSSGNESITGLFRRAERVMIRVKEGGKHYFDVDRLAIRMRA